VEKWQPRLEERSSIPQEEGGVGGGYRKNDQRRNGQKKKGKAKIGKAYTSAGPGLNKKGSMLKVFQIQVKQNLLSS